MPFVFKQTGKSDGCLIGTLRIDFRDVAVRIPLKQPRPQHKRGMTLLRETPVRHWCIGRGWYESAELHCAPSRTSDGSQICPDYLKMRKRLSFPTTE